MNFAEFVSKHPKTIWGFPRYGVSLSKHAVNMSPSSATSTASVPTLTAQQLIAESTVSVERKASAIQCPTVPSPAVAPTCQSDDAMNRSCRGTSSPTTENEEGDDRMVSVIAGSEGIGFETQMSVYVAGGAFGETQQTNVLHLSSRGAAYQQSHYHSQTRFASRTGSTASAFSTFSSSSSSSSASAALKGRPETKELDISTWPKVTKFCGRFLYQEQQSTSASRAAIMHTIAESSTTSGTSRAEEEADDDDDDSNDGGNNTKECREDSIAAALRAVSKEGLVLIQQLETLLTCSPPALATDPYRQLVLRLAYDRIVDWLQCRTTPQTGAEDEEYASGEEEEEDDGKQEHGKGNEKGVNNVASFADVKQVMGGEVIVKLIRRLATESSASSLHPPSHSRALSCSQYMEQAG